MDQTTLIARIGAMNDLKEQKDALNDQLKELNAQIDAAEANVISAILDVAEAAGLEDPSMFTVDVDGRRYGIKVKQFYSIRKEKRDEAFAALRGLGLGDLIVEKVDDRTLTKALEEIVDRNGELPEEYSALPVSIYEKTTVTSRKVGR